MGRIPRRSELPLGPRPREAASRLRHERARRSCGLLVQWNLAAPTRPSSAASPFDPAYKFDDIDEALRSAQETDMEVMLTISGTPRWANGGRNHNVIPRRMADFTAFARAIATRYSGRFNGYPFVRFYSDLERAEPQPLPDAPVQRRRQVGRAGELREARTRRPMRASRRGTRWRRSGSARRRRADATGGCRVSRTRTRPGSSPSSWRRPIRGSSSTRGRTTRTRSTRTRSRPRS